MIFENPQAFEYYEEITKVHRLIIRAHEEMIFTEKEGKAILNNIIMAQTNKPDIFIA